MKRPLYYGHQYLDQEDEEAVLEVLRADRLTQGPYVDRFEAALREYFGPAHAVTCSSGTAALHLAALCLKWDAEDVVLVPAITFAASANCCRYVGAEPFFVDIQDDTLTIDPNEVERHVKRLRDAGRRVRAVVGVDMAGHPCDWPALRQIADRYDLQLVGDSCHAMGALISDGSKIGACRHTDVTILSFHPVKHITTGEGGALLTNDASIAERAAQLRSHGIKRDGIADWEGPWHYDMRELGYNYRLTDLQSALGISQMRKLDRFLARRRELAALYVSAFRDAPRLRCPSERAPARHAYHLFIARIDFANAPLSRRELFERSKQRGIQLQVHYRPVPENTYYHALARAQGADRHLPVSYRYYSEAFSLPLYPGLEDRDVEWVADVIQSLIEHAPPRTKSDPALTHNV